MIIDIEELKEDCIQTVQDWKETTRAKAEEVITEDVMELVIDAMWEAQMEELRQL